MYGEHSRSYKCVDDDILLDGCKALGEQSAACIDVVVDKTNDVGLISRDFRGRIVKSWDCCDIWDVATSVTISACVTLHCDNGLCVTYGPVWKPFETFDMFWFVSGVPELDPDPSLAGPWVFDPGLTPVIDPGDIEYSWIDGKWLLLHDSRRSSFNLFKCSVLDWDVRFGFEHDDDDVNALNMFLSEFNYYEIQGFLH